MAYESIYPPKFSSTETYANRYDLDEIDVFLEGKPNNPMFFTIKELPEILNYGKHNFIISVLDPEEHNQPYRLKPNSRILFEFKSKNNVVLKSDIYKVSNKNGTAICYVEILKDPLRTFEEIEDGEGTLTVVGSLIDIENIKHMDSQQSLNSYSHQLNRRKIPEKFKNAINYRCTFPIDIRKNYMKDVVQHTLCTTFGQFSFTKAPISPIKTTGLGLTYSPTTGKPNIILNPYHRGGGRGSGKS